MTDEKLFTGESHYQRRKRLEREGVAWWMPQKPAETPTEPAEPKPQTDLEKLIAGASEDEMSQLIDEFGDDADFVNLAKARLQPKNEDAEQAELRRQYQERYAKLPAGPQRAYSLKRLNDEFHAMGLKD